MGMKVIMAGPEDTPVWLKNFDTKPIGITVKIKAKPEHRNDLVIAMKRHQKVTIEEEGVEAVPHFKLHTSPFDDHIFYLVEEWASAKALKKHFVAGYMWQLVDEMKLFLVPSTESQTYVALYDLGFDSMSTTPGALAVVKRGSAAEPMENFGELSDFMKVIMAGPEETPVWLKNFDMKRHQKVTMEEEGVEAVPHFKLHTSPFDDHIF